MAYYILVLPVETIGHQLVYSRLPLHCTLLPWFYAKESQETLRREFEHLLLKSGPVTLTSVSAAMFGPDGNIPVHTIAETKPLMKLHAKCFQLASELGVTFTKPDYVGAGYQPHVTNCPWATMYPEQQHTAREAVLITGRENQQYKPLCNFSL